MIEQGEKVYIVLRKLFEADKTRQFVGEVLEASDTVMKVHGYTFVHDSFTNEFVKREDIRTRIISMVDAANIIIIIPREVVVENVQFDINNRNQHVITDKATFSMNLSEFWVSK